MKPRACPFCGHRDIQLHSLGDRYYVICMDCNATGPKVIGVRYAVTAWNGSHPIKWLSEWEDTLIWCPSQLTRRFEHDGEERELYCRWRWCDPWTVSILGGHSLGCGLTQDTPISEVHEMAETMLRSWLCV